MVCIGLFFVAHTCFGNQFREARNLEPNLENGKKIYLACAACHQPEGWGSTSGVIPQIAGQHFRVITKQLEDISNGNRDSRQMTPFANEALLGGAQGIADVAGYIASLPMTPAPEYGNGNNLSQGGSLYRAGCARLCHGKNGEGHNQKLKPRIQGQHYTYLVRQMKLIRDGQRKDAHKTMVRKIKRRSDEELEAMADYLSRMKPDPELLAPEGWKNPDFR